MEKVAILLTCHNRKEKTINCLYSLYKAIELTNQSYAFDIFLVDDNSTDGTSDAVNVEFPQINIIHGNGHLYWNRGMNLAWETAAKENYDFYFWLNDDNILFTESIQNLLVDSKQKQDKSIIVGVCQSKSGTVSYSGYIGLKKKIKLIPAGIPILCDYFNGNVVLVPSFVFNKVGFLNSVFHHGQGDFDYGLRAKQMDVNSFISSHFISQCEPHNDLPVWCNPKYSLQKRWKSFNSPLGGNPKARFIFQKKYIGLISAIFHYFTLHLRLFYPTLWKK